MSDTASQFTATSRRVLVNRYELVSLIGRGAMGEVWRVWDWHEEQSQAAKLLRPEFVQDPEILSRFLQEFSILRSLTHANIVKIHDRVAEGDDLAIIMDLVPGGSLGDYRKVVNTLAPAVAVPLIAVVLEALSYAHAQGVLHRDIKPDNILLTEPGLPHPETVRLSDFGIARLTQEGTVQATSQVGTPLYMPPEMVQYGLCSPKSDVYAAGIVLYELLAGRTPFAGPGTPVTIGQRHVHASVPPLSIAPALWQLLMAILAKDPAHRPTAAEATMALHGLALAGLDINPLSPQPEPDSWAKSRSVLPGESMLGREADADPTAKPSDHDSNATIVRPGSLTSPPAEPIGDSRVAPSEEPIDPSRTQIKTAVHHVIPSIMPEPIEGSRNTKKRMLISGGAFGLILVTVGFCG